MVLAKNLNKITVTGANGYIGHHVVSQLIKNQDISITAVDFKNDKIDKNVNYKNVDILNNALSRDLYAKLEKPNALLHLAWQDGFNHYAESHINSITNHFYFLKNIIDSGITSLTVMGTVHEIGYYEGQITEKTPCNPLSYYGIAKNTLRQLLFAYAKNKNVSIKWLRAFYITGDDWNNHSVFTKILEAEKRGDREFPFVEGLNQFDFIDIEELAEMIVKASLQDNITGIINVCSGKPVSLKDKVQEFKKQHNLNIELKYGVFPPRQYDSPIVFGDNKAIKKILEM